MCGIAGYCDFTKDMRESEKFHKEVARKMGETLVHRGPDASGVYVSEHAAFAHTRLAVIDVEGGAQPMTRELGERTCAIVYNGELYNTNEIRSELVRKGYVFESMSDTEVLLLGYAEFGENILYKINGIYSFAIWDSWKKCVFLARDPYGVKPLFYTIKHGVFLFGSEIKSLLAHPYVEPVINQYGLCELFGLGPARSTGCGVYEDIYEIPPGYKAYVDYSGCKISCYFKMQAEEHKENYKETVEHTRYLLFNAIERQLVSDVPICTLLSGGLDSSVVSSVAARYFKKQGKVLDTYSFDYPDNNIHFKSSSFQPEEDRPYVDKMVAYLGTNHHYLECDYQDLYDCLFEAVRAKDLPGMADVDSSLLHFARGVKENHTVCLSGECADEIFGGYPWFRDEEIYEKEAFPWSKNLDFRKEVLNKELLKKLPLEEYVAAQYRKTMSLVPLSGEETKRERRQKEISYLNTAWFMTTLLDRKDRMTMASGLEVRVPFADYRLISYLYNVPWEFKYHNSEVKGLLKDVAAQILPEEVLYRKKCPYPKTYHPGYEKLLKDNLMHILEKKDEPLGTFVDKEYLKKLMNAPSDYGKPWFGQLMALPQMYAYLIEINYWLKEYKVQVRL